MCLLSLNGEPKERTAVEKCVVLSGRLSTTHFWVYPYYWSMLFELYAHIISTAYGLDDWLVDFLYHLEGKIVRFLTVCSRIEFFLQPCA